MYNQVNTVQKMSHSQVMAAKYMARLLSADIMKPESCEFYKYLSFSGVNLKSLLLDLYAVIRNKPDREENSLALDAVNEARSWTINVLTRDFNDIISDNPCLRESLRQCVLKYCTAISCAEAEDAENYRLAVQKIAELFSLSPTAQTLLEFLYICEIENEVFCYLEHELDIGMIRNRKMLAEALDTNISSAVSAFYELMDCKIASTNFSHNEIIIDNHTVFEVFENSDKELSELFCAPLRGNTLPLDNFSISSEDLNCIINLMKSDSDMPVHILLYGPPGTGKSTFARSLAHELGFNAWTAESQEAEERNCSSVIACINLAAKHPGSFAVVDEAEKILHTSLESTRGSGREKYWLNNLLEKPGNRVIWITNHVDNIHPSVMRRFSFSVHFKEASRKEREKLLTSIIERHNLQDSFARSDIEALAKNYNVPAAVMESSITQAEELVYGKDGFIPAIELSMKSYIRLINGGQTVIRSVSNEVNGFILSSLTLDGYTTDDIMYRCRCADEAMKKADGNIEDGYANMLFYGPQGTGKTSFAKHIAYELDRECIVHKGSNLLHYMDTMRDITGFFRHAEDKGAVLIIDEADEFLAHNTQDLPRASFLSIQRRKFLMCLEECRTFCICITNSFKELDAASLRNFSLKVHFSYSDWDQVLELYDALLQPLCNCEFDKRIERELRTLTRLTPGDFHAVRKQYASYLYDSSKINHEVLLNALKHEISLKYNNNEWE